MTDPTQEPSAPAEPTAPVSSAGPTDVPEAAAPAEIAAPVSEAPERTRFAEPAGATTPEPTSAAGTSGLRFLP